MQINLSPLGFHMWADRYLDCYQDSRQPAPDSPVPHLLLCRVIELEFKAWHRQVQKRKVLTNKFGHDFVASYGALPAKQRILSAEEVVLLTRANEIYAKKSFEHIGVGLGAKSFEARSDLVALETMTQKIMEYGDGMDVAQGS